MKTDLIFLPLFIPQTDTLRSIFRIYRTYKSPNANSYAIIYNINSKKQYSYHNFIMGSKIIDHINNDGLDNRLENLRFSNHSHNNQNKNLGKEEIIGVYRTKHKNKEIYAARSYVNKISFIRQFDTKIYGDRAKEFAIRYRKNILEINCSVDDFMDLPLTKQDVPVLKNSLIRTQEYLADMLNRIPGYNQYLPDTEKLITDSQKEIIYICYLRIQSCRISLIKLKIKKLYDAIQRANSAMDINEILEV